MMQTQSKGESVTLSMIDEALDAILLRVEVRPRIGLILGSGLGALAQAVEQAVIIPYELIPHWPVPTVVGHQGELVIGLLEGKPVLVMRGRAHFYEGYSMQQVTFPVRVMQRLDIQVLIVTNAAGAVNQKFTPGDIMLITDHLNLVGMAGNSPLRGENLDEFGPRFPDMGQAYDRALCQAARQAAAQAGIPLHEGVYACLAGPSFETPADLRFLRLAGVDAVGMSTVPEVTVARHGGLRVLGLSGISNKANLDGNTLTTHEEVLEAGERITPKMVSLLRGVLKGLA